MYSCEICRASNSIEVSGHQSLGKEGLGLVLDDAGFGGELYWNSGISAVQLVYKHTTDL